MPNLNLMQTVVELLERHDLMMVGYELQRHDIAQLVRNGPQNGVHVSLVTGEVGTGKSFHVEQVLRDLEEQEDDEVEVVWFDPLVDDGVLCAMEPDKALRKFFEKRVLRQSHAELVVVVMDDVHLYFGESCDRVLLLTLVDVLSELRSSSRNVAVVMVTSYEEELDRLLTRLVDSYVEFDLPTSDHRALLWKEILCDHGFDEGEMVVRKLNSKCHGWVAADIVHVVSTYMALHDTETIQEETLMRILETYQPIVFRLGDRSSGQTSGSAPWTVVSPHDIDVGWDDISGLKEVKESLKEMVVWPRVHKALFEELHVDPPNGVLLYGPPGTGKTLLASAVAKEADANFMTVSIGDVIRGNVGDSEKAIAKVFKMARKVTPCILYFDEFQAIFGNRDHGGTVTRKIISQFLLETDQLPKDIILIGSTNVLEAIDPSILRAGRFDKKLHVPLPDPDSRLELLINEQRAMQTWSPAVSLATLVQATAGLNGADIKAMCEQAAMFALMENKTSIDERHFLKTLDNKTTSRSPVF